jgi:hypothetical protein
MIESEILLHQRNNGVDSGLGPAEHVLRGQLYLGWGMQLTPVQNGLSFNQRSAAKLIQYSMTPLLAGKTADPLRLYPTLWSVGVSHPHRLARRLKQLQYFANPASPQML